MIGAPPVPERDVLVGFAPHFTSYGPRVERGPFIEPALESEVPRYWSVYQWHPEHRWQWVADCGSEEIAYRLAVCWQERMCHGH